MDPDSLLLREKLTNLSWALRQQAVAAIEA